MKWLNYTLILCILVCFPISLAYGDWEIGALWEIGDLWDIEGWPPVVPVVVSYPDYASSSDGNVLMYGGLELKPNDIHTYVPQFDGNYQNITLEDGVLTLSKSLWAYNIECDRNDNVTTNIQAWFYGDITRFTAYAESLVMGEVTPHIDFTVNGRNKGEPRGVTGAESWSYDADTSTVSLTAYNNTVTTIHWIDTGAQQLEWYLDRIPMWLGLAGMILITLAPCMIVYFGKQGDLQSAFIYSLFFFVLGTGCIIGWLW